MSPGWFKIEGHSNRPHRKAFVQSLKLLQDKQRLGQGVVASETSHREVLLQRMKEDFIRKVVVGITMVLLIAALTVMIVILPNRGTGGNSSAEPFVETWEHTQE